MSPDAALAAQKERAARIAVEEVRDGMVVGLGTGSTADFAVREIGRRVRAGLNILGVPTSGQTASLATELGIATLDLSRSPGIDLAIDGVDAIDPQMRAIKGRGGAMLREKIVATAAARTIFIADASKAVDTLATTLLPVEVLPFALAFVEASLGRIGLSARLRLHADGTPWKTDQDNVIVDCDLTPIEDLAALERALSAIPGVLGHGLFLHHADAVYLGLPDGTVTQSERDAAGESYPGRVKKTPAEILVRGGKLSRGRTSSNR